MKQLTTKKIIVIVILIALFTTFCGIFTACNGKITGKQFETYDYFNTATTLVIYDDFTNKDSLQQAENIWENIKLMLSDIESALSVDIEGSDVAKFNNFQGGLLEISECTYDILKVSQELYTFTEGAFNPALGLYVDLWGFSPRFSDLDYTAVKNYDRADYKNKLPNVQYLEGFASLTDFSKIVLSEGDGKYFVFKPLDKVTINDEEYTMNINLGGIGKGYATDKVFNYLQDKGYFKGYISVGRSSIGLLKNEVKIKDAPTDNDWKVGLINPFDTAEQYADIFLNNTSLSTSGDYENFYEIGDTRYSHIIDGSTFYPTNNTINSVTVVNSSAAYCDAMSTALCVMGIDKAREFVSANMLNDEVVIVYKNGENIEVFVSTDSNNFVVTNNDFALKPRAVLL